MQLRIVDFILSSDKNCGFHIKIWKTGFLGSVLQKRENDGFAKSGKQINFLWSKKTLRYIGFHESA